jgi:hypothetical protein
VNLGFAPELQQFRDKVAQWPVAAVPALLAALTEDISLVIYARAGNLGRFGVHNQ